MSVRCHISEAPSNLEADKRSTCPAGLRVSDASRWQFLLPRLTLVNQRVSPCQHDRILLLKPKPAAVTRVYSYPVLNTLSGFSPWTPAEKPDVISYQKKPKNKPRPKKQQTHLHKTARLALCLQPINLGEVSMRCQCQVFYTLCVSPNAF